MSNDDKIDRYLDVLYKSKEQSMFSIDLYNDDHYMINVPYAIDDMMIDQGLIKAYQERRTLTYLGVEICEMGGWKEYKKMAAKRLAKKQFDEGRNIVNYHVFGGTNNTNIGVGDNVVLSENRQDIKVDYTQFRELLTRAGVPSEQISVVEEIVKSGESKESKLSKAMKWIGDLSRQVLEKSIELKLPEIIEATQRMIEQVAP